MNENPSTRHEAALAETKTVFEDRTVIHVDFFQRKKKAPVYPLIVNPDLPPCDVEA